MWLQDSRPLAPALAALCRVAKEANACPRGIHSSFDLPDPWQRGDDPCETEVWLRIMGTSRYRRRAQNLGVARAWPAEALPATNGSWSARSGGVLRSIARSMIRVPLRHRPDYPHGLLTLETLGVSRARILFLFALPTRASYYLLAASSDKLPSWQRVGPGLQPLNLLLNSTAGGSGRASRR